jgi:hypothetical protein
MDRIYLILYLLIVLTVGFLQILFRLRKHKGKVDFGSEFFKKFNEYYSSEGKDEESYIWLTYNSNKMQTYLGLFGICDYLPPFHNSTIKNYRIILNTLTEVRKEFSGIYYFSNPRRAKQYADMIRDSIIRYSGFMNEVITELQKDLINPIVWAREGIKSILSLPIFLLFQFGLISEKLYEDIKSSFLLKLISATVTFIGFFGAIIGIVTGWGKFISILDEIIKK